MTSDAGSTHWNTANPDTNAGEPTNMQADGGEGKSGILGRWTVVQRYGSKRNTPPQPRRSFGENPGWKTKPSRFEGLQTLTEEMTDMTAEAQEHAPNGRAAGNVETGHVSPRGMPRETGRGGRGLGSRGGMIGRGSRDSQPGQGNHSEWARWEARNTQVDRQVSVRPTHRGRGGHLSLESSRILSASARVSYGSQMGDQTISEMETPPLLLMSSVDRMDFDLRNEPHNPLALVSCSNKPHYEMVEKITGLLGDEGRLHQRVEGNIEMEEPLDPGEEMGMEEILETRQELSGKRTSTEHFHIPKKGRLEQGGTQQNPTC
ncbi:hypothetical protein J5N97_015963 [Dioscorea zingiberensis]|uniref:Uncharacterized protein n=1 Tax=Dioscorea zingiberensis TaxID=325984 RepID=A0A9D5HF63_9LILI|nr:hypothetical protein J5N97_015963 [Dioscorea zingiberensis]